MAQELFKASAPGSLMLLGEHAVLHGQSSLVCAINKRIETYLEKRNDDTIKIISDLGKYKTTLSNFKLNNSLKFVLTAISKKKHLLSTGFNLNIKSKIPLNTGLSSSAAVTVATLAMLNKWIQGTVTLTTLFEESLQVVKTIQGYGSGADIVAAIYGNIISFKPSPLTIKKLDKSFPITVVYSGNKKPTSEVITIVSNKEKKQPELFKKIYSIMGKCSQKAKEAINRQDWHSLGEILNINQGLMDAIGVNNQKLSRLIFDLRKDPEILGAKISGSGLGDCVIAIGKSQKKYDNKISVNISNEGLKIEKL